MTNLIWHDRNSIKRRRLSLCTSASNRAAGIEIIPGVLGLGADLRGERELDLEEERDRDRFLHTDEVLEHVLQESIFDLHPHQQNILTQCSFALHLCCMI